MVSLKIDIQVQLALEYEFQNKDYNLLMTLNNIDFLCEKEVQRMVMKQIKRL